MRFLALAASLVLLSTTPTAWSVDADLPDFVPDMSHSRLFGASAVRESVEVSATKAPTSAPTSSPAWTTGYGINTLNIFTKNVADGSPFKAPYPPHTLQLITPVVVNNVTKIAVDPLPVGERFNTSSVFGPRGTAIFATIPLSSLAKRTGYSSKYNNTAFTSVSQFPKVGAGKLPTDKIDIFDDEFFGLMRFAGPNPTVIRKISSISPKFGDAATLRTKYAQFDSLLKNGQIYELDYWKLATIPSALLNIPLPAPDDSILAYPANGNPGPQQRYLAAPYVLLQHVTENRVSKIVPIAIQLGQSYVAGTTAVLYRADYKDVNGAAKAGVDQGDWNYAKTIVNAADATIHELDAHLTRTHFVMENVIIGTHVNLPENHVISRLLIGDGQHHLKTLQINEDGRTSLIPGIVDEVFAGGYIGAALLLNNLYKSYNYTADYVPTDLSARGFDNLVNPKSNRYDQQACLQPDGTDAYLYAQDAVQSWNILFHFVDSVLTSTQYKKDQDVAADTALQAWAAYLSSPRLTGYPYNTTTSIPVPGFPSSFTTQKALSTAVTAALYKSTVGHSVVNYPQPFYNAYIPVYPALALYRPILTASQVGTGLTTDAYIAAALGNANTQQVMAATANGLGQPLPVAGLPDDITLLQYASLAASARVPSNDKVGRAIQKAANNLLNDLTELSEYIQDRDANFVADDLPHYQYGYFDPQRVANAIFA